MDELQLSAEARAYAERYRLIAETNHMRPSQTLDLVATAFECGRLSGLSEAAKY